MSEYQKIQPEQKRRGRKPLPPEERARRRELQRQENRKRQEARRRAHMVLQQRHEDEFALLFKTELAAIKGDNA